MATDRHDALLASLAEHPHQPVVQIDMAERHADELGDPHARAVEGFEDGAITTGAVEAMVDGPVALWDLAPMPVIMAEAGGRFTDTAGNTARTAATIEKVLAFA